MRIVDNLAFVTLSDHPACVACGTSDCEGKYTNWIDVAPRHTDEQCVVITHYSGRWDVSDCRTLRNYICQFRKTIFAQR